MKSLLVTAFVLMLALLAVPAYADSIALTNQGILSASAGVGISVHSAVDSFSVDGHLLLSGDVGQMLIETGAFATGSIFTGGQFNSGTWNFTITGAPDVALFANSFAGTWTKLGDDLFQLVGNFTGDDGGSGFTGTTTQLFALEFEHGQACFRDLNGVTTITPVPEPGTLALLGSGLLGLGGAIRRKSKSATN